MAYTDNEEKRPVGSYPATGIDVLIVGTGLAGLTAAIECVRKGHSVRVLERSADINTAGECPDGSCCYRTRGYADSADLRPGDMYFMGHSATKFFRHWPEMQEEYDKISMKGAWMETFKHSGERMIEPLKVSERLRSAGMDPDTPPGTFQMRPLVYRMYVRQVEKLGVEIMFNQRVVDYYEDANNGKGGVRTEKGEAFEADVVIAADGIGSKSQKLVGGEVRAMSSGRAMWRAAFPRRHLDRNPQVKEFFSLYGAGNDEPTIRTWLG